MTFCKKENVIPLENYYACNCFQYRRLLRLKRSSSALIIFHVQGNTIKDCFSWNNPQLLLTTFHNLWNAISLLVLTIFRNLGNSVDQCFYILSFFFSHSDNLSNHSKSRRRPPHHEPLFSYLGDNLHNLSECCWRPPISCYLLKSWVTTSTILANAVEDCPSRAIFSNLWWKLPQS